MTLFGMPIDLAGALFIFCLRLADVTLGTIRTVLVMRGVRFVAALVGFFEIIIWVVAISRVMGHLDSVFNVIAYAAGYSCGILMGIFVEERLALGVTVVNIIVHEDEARLADELRQAGFGVTRMEAFGMRDQMHLLRVGLPRRKVNQLVRLCRKLSPKSFLTVEDVRGAYGGYLP